MMKHAHFFFVFKKTLSTILLSKNYSLFYFIFKNCFQKITVKYLKIDFC